MASFALATEGERFSRMRHCECCSTPARRSGEVFRLPNIRKFSTERDNERGMKETIEPGKRRLGAISAPEYQDIYEDDDRRVPDALSKCATFRSKDNRGSCKSEDARTAKLAIPRGFQARFRDHHGHF
jgi:hypothetical protein